MGFHDHSHGHHHHPPQTGRALIASLALTIVFVAIEALAGWWAGSLALLSDAGHNFQDAFGLVLAAAAWTFESRPVDERRTYGYQRAGVLAAFVNSLLLVAISVYIMWESYERLRNPQPINELTMIVVAAVGLGVNLAIAWSLRGNGHDLNIRAAVLHQLGDAASCVAIIAGAVVIHYTGWLAIDPLLSFLISLVIIWSAWGIFKDSLNILLEGLPKGLNLDTVVRELRQVDGVEDVHDLHIWSLGSDARALSAHLVIDDMPPSESNCILRGVNALLARRFDIHHTTIQFEHRRCELADADCSAGRRPHLHQHSH